MIYIPQLEKEVKKKSELFWTFIFPLISDDGSSDYIEFITSVGIIFRTSTVDGRLTFYILMPQSLFGPGYDGLLGTPDGDNTNDLIAYTEKGTVTLDPNSGADIKYILGTSCEFYIWMHFLPDQTLIYKKLLRFTMSNFGLAKWTCVGVFIPYQYFRIQFQAY